MRTIFKNLFFLLLFGLSIILSEKISAFFDFPKTDLLLKAMILITTIGLIVAAAILIGYFFLKSRIKTIALIFFSSFFTIFLGIFLKNFFQIPRPESVKFALPLTFAGGFGFPSLHTAFIFCLLPIIEKEISRRAVIFWYSLAFLIAFSRIYLGVHSLTDVTGGMAIGYGIGTLSLFLENQFGIIERFFHHIKNKFELRRQIVHLLIGVSIVILFEMRILTIPYLFLILIAGGLLSFVSRKSDVPVIKTLLRYFERDYPMSRFPGQGSFFLVLGSLLALIMFPHNVALASIMIMAVGDSITHIVGVYFGKVKFPLNPEKNLEGFVIATVLSTLAALPFISLKAAFLGSVVSMFVESLDLKLGSWKIDDNLIIPLLAGVIMMNYL